MSTPTPDIATTNKEEIVRLIHHLNTVVADSIKELRELVSQHEEKLSLLEPLLDSSTERQRKRVRFPLVLEDEDSVCSEAEDIFYPNSEE